MINGPCRRLRVPSVPLPVYRNGSTNLHPFLLLSATAGVHTQQGLWLVNFYGVPFRLLPAGPAPCRQPAAGPGCRIAFAYASCTSNTVHGYHRSPNRRLLLGACPPLQDG